MVERVSDFKMPEKVVTKLLKDSLPDNVVVSKDAKNAVCRSASIFILQLSIAAAEKAQENKRRTLDNHDIIRAVTDLGLGEYAPQLVRFGAQRKRNAKRKESNIQKRKKTSNQESGGELENQSTNPDETLFEASMDEELDHDINGDEGQNGDDIESLGEEEHGNTNGINNNNNNNHEEDGNEDENENFVDAETTALGSDSHNEQDED